MAHRKHRVKTFFRRLKFAWTNARRSEKQFKETGIVFLPNGSVFVNPKQSLYSHGYEVVPVSQYDEEDDLEDWDWEDEEEDEEDEEDEDLLY